MDPPTTTARRSGIPRPSKLPVPSSTIAPTTLTAAVTRPNAAGFLGSSTSTGPRAPRLAAAVPARPTVRPVAASRTAKPQAFTSDKDSLGVPDGIQASSQQCVQDTPLLVPAPSGVPKSRKPRPSLSDRTVESLATVATTPDRRRSTFFMPESPLASPSFSNSTFSLASPREPLTPRGLSPPKRSIPPRASSSRATPRQNISETRSTPTPARRSVTASVAATPSRNNRLGASARKPPQLKSVTTSENTPRKTSNSSALLRAQIAKAKQEARRVSTKTTSAPSWDAENDDPFNQHIQAGGNSGVLLKRIDAARIDGRLNIAGLGLSEIPDVVLRMYDYDPDSNVVWSECVDLVRFNAADNDIKTLPDSAFPDQKPNFGQDEEISHQFGGVELLDLHGNQLVQLPVGFRRLEHLTSLNLSRNKLADLMVITQIPNLRDLRLGENSIDQLPASISQLSQLEVLELQNNTITALPDSIQELRSLRVLNVTHNQITDLRIDLLAELPVVQILASKNRISGALITRDLSMSRLQTLDISGNALTSLIASTVDKVDVPSLQTLNFSFNRVSSLPSIASWTSLVTVLAEDNCLASLPEGFTTLGSLKSVDVTGNDIKVLDPLISQMENLEVLTVNANPLRDRKFLTLTTEEIKKSLAARLDRAGFVI